MLCLLCATLTTHAQDDAPNLWLEEHIEQQYADPEAGDTDWEDELEALEHLRRHPLDLNRASREDLERFPFLSDRQIAHILAYRHKHGALQSIFELRLVEGMDAHTISLLRPFVQTVAPASGQSAVPSLASLLKQGRHSLLARADYPLYTREGYRGSYLGPKVYHSLRYAFSSGRHLAAGVTGEKDAGEPFFALHDRKGYDHYAYYLQLQDLGFLKKLVAGTYRLDFGLGLVVSHNPLGMGKSFDLSTANVRSRGISKHGSTDEYNYFRGIAATVGIGRDWEVSAFYSHRRMDGVVENGEITSIYKTGLHRTEAEADKTGRFTLQAAGGNLTYRGAWLKVGLTGLYYVFSLPYEPDYRDYARHNLHGYYAYNFGLDYRLRAGAFSWTGEAAKGKRGFALLNRLTYALSSDCKLLLAHRFYSHDYWAFFAHSFGEGSTPQNENGWYLAASFRPGRRWEFFASADFFAFPWWRYRISKPSNGFDLMAKVGYVPAQAVSMYVTYRYKRKERDVTGTGGSLTLPTYQHRLRYRLTARLGRGWQARTTADYTCFAQPGQTRSQGWLLTQAGTFAPETFPLSATLQVSYFHTDDYDSRVYAYERGPLYTFYIPSFQGRGLRFSLMVDCELGHWGWVSAKFGQTVYHDRSTIGTGRDLIDSNRKADVQVQFRLLF